MKPSKRILSMWAELQQGGHWSPDSAACHIQAILQYLDEEWEKNKPCEHEIRYKTNIASGIKFSTGIGMPQEAMAYCVKRGKE